MRLGIDLGGSHIGIGIVNNIEGKIEEKVEEDYPQIIKDLTYHLIKESIVKDNEIKVEDADVETFAKFISQFCLAETFYF